jgi:hypothetical protein
VPGSETQAGRRYGAYAPAAVGLAVLVGLVEIRMNEPWAVGVLLVVAAIPALLLLWLALGAAGADTPDRVAVTILVVTGLVLAAVAVGRLGQTLAGDDFAEGGGTLTWTLALFTAIAALTAVRTRSVAALLFAALAAVGLVVEAVNWIFGVEDIDTFRVLLALAFAALFAAGVAVGGRAGTILVAAAGVTVLASFYVLIAGFFGPGLGWGWELILLLEGLALAFYAAWRREPGPGYLAFFVLALFVVRAAVTGQGGVFLGSLEESESSSSLVGWPLAIAIVTLLAALWGARAARSAAQGGETPS